MNEWLRISFWLHILYRSFYHWFCRYVWEVFLTNLKSRIMRAAEFDTRKFLYNAGYDNDRPLNSSEEWCVKGGKSANLQLRPLIEALAEVAEQLAKFKNGCGSDYCTNPDCGCTDSLDNLERVVGKYD